MKIVFSYKKPIFWVAVAAVIIVGSVVGGLMVNSKTKAAVITSGTQTSAPEQMSDDMTRSSSEAMNNSSSSLNTAAGSSTASSAVSKANPTAAPVSVIYKNMQYGFLVKLPDSWKDYTLVADKWNGMAADGSKDKTVETGSIIYIRNPLWTSKNPYQDIPVMIFTLKQWGLVQSEKIVIGAAPIGPSELGRNSKYVFALPARYNYSYLTGYEEVDKILKSNSLHTFEIGK